MIYSILQYPDQRLKTKAVEVQNDEFNVELFHIVRNMYETMYNANGVGLAATQVNTHRRIIVTNVDGTERTFINPIMEIVGTEKQKYTEGCLSFPGVKLEKSRPNTVLVEYRTINGSTEQITCNHLLSVCIQHEIDHLDGVTFIDDLSSFKKQRLIDKYF